MKNKGHIIYDELNELAVSPDPKKVRDEQHMFNKEETHHPEINFDIAYGTHNNNSLNDIDTSLEHKPMITKKNPFRAKLIVAIRRFIKELQYSEYWEKCWFSIYIIGILTAAAASIMFLVPHLYNSNHMLQEIEDAAEYLAFNFQLKPILDLRLTNGTSCPSNYDSINLGTWPGTREGCLLINNSLIQKVACNVKGAKSIPSLRPMSYTKWKNTTFCAKYSNDYYYNATCKYGYQLCGPGICFNIKDGCPITDLIISNEDFNADNKTLFKSYFSLASSNLTLYSKHEINKEPIVQLLYSNNMPCFEPRKIPPSNFSYPFLKSNGDHCIETYFDNFSHIIDYDSLIKFEEWNGIAQFYPKLQGYKQIIQDQLSFLVIRKRPLIKQNMTISASECYPLHPLVFKSMHNSLDESSKLKTILGFGLCAINIFELIRAIINRKKESKTTFLWYCFGFIINCVIIFIIYGVIWLIVPIDIDKKAEFLNCYEDKVFNNSYLLYKSLFGLHKFELFLIGIILISSLCGLPYIMII